MATIVYNVEPALVNLVFTKGDSIDITLNVTTYNQTTRSYEDHDMTGSQLDLHVRDLDDNLIRAFSSAGASPEITIATAMFTLYSDTPFDEVGKYAYDLQETEGTKVSTIMKGVVNVQKETTQ